MDTTQEGLRFSPPGLVAIIPRVPNYFKISKSIKSHKKRTQTHQKLDFIGKTELPISGISSMKFTSSVKCHFATSG